MNRQKMTINDAEQMTFQFHIQGMLRQSIPIFLILIIQRHIAYYGYFIFIHFECSDSNKNEKDEKNEESYGRINFYIKNTAEGFFIHSYFFTGLFVISTPSR